MHYFHADDYQVRKNYLGSFFYDHSHVENREYRHKVISEFWENTERDVRQNVFKQLVKKVTDQTTKGKTSQENLLLNPSDLDEERGSAGEHPTGLVSDTNLNHQNFDGWSVSAKLSSNTDHSDTDAFFRDKEEDFMRMDHLDVTTQSQIAFLLTKANNIYEVDRFINYLVYSKIDR